MVPKPEQSKNKRIWFDVIEYKGEKISKHKISLSLGGSHGLVSERIKRYGWTLEKAINTPIQKHNL